MTRPLCCHVNHGCSFLLGTTPLYSTILCSFFFFSLTICLIWIQLWDSGFKRQVCYAEAYISCCHVDRSHHNPLNPTQLPIRQKGAVSDITDRLRYPPNPHATTNRPATSSQQFSQTAFWLIRHTPPPPLKVSPPTAHTPPKVHT